MKYNKLLKKEVLSLLLAGSLVFTGMPAWATDSVDGNAAWEDSNESGTETDQQDTFASADSADASDGFSDAEDIQAPDGDDGFFDGEAEEQTSGFSSLDSGDPSPEDDNSIEENGLTDEEIEAQLEPIRELEPLSYVDPPSGNGNGDTGSVGAVRAASYPARYDPRSSLSLPVRNQKPSNMCWAYTLAANLEISFKRAGAGLFDLSEEHLAYFFANRKNDPLGNTANDRNEVQHSYREGGNQTLAAIFLSTWSGMALESQVPYETNADHTLDSEKVPDPSMAYKTTAYLENAAFSSYSVNNIKNLILEYGSVSMSFGMYDSYYNPHMYAYSYPGSAGVNHAVTLVGWDDNFSRENFNEDSEVTSDGAWIARNSWGDDWGDGGYFYISYQNKCNYNIVAAEATISPKYRNNYFYDGSCALSKLKLYPSGSSGISSVSNVFQAKAGNGKGEALGEVVLATYTDGGSYSIQIYTNLEDKSNPVSGTPAYSSPVTFYQEHAGISTVKVPEVNLMSGTLYSVVVTNIGSYAVDYLCETNSAYDWVGFNADLRENQSFCYHEKSGWNDFSKTSPSACARIKAHTRTLGSVVTVQKPSSMQASAKAYNRIGLTWTKASGVSGYQIYRKESGGEYKKMTTLSWNYSTWTDTTVKPGITYTYKLRAYSMVNGTAKYSGFTVERAVKPALSTPSVSVKVSSGGYNTVSWNKISGAESYVVYRKTSSGKWTKISTIKKAATTSYKDKKIKAATVYEYTVRACCTVNKKTVASSYKSSGKYKSAPSTQTISSVSNVKKGLKIKWKAQKKCDGYYIYRKTGSGKYTLTATIKKGSTSSWTDTKVKKGKKYTYYVRAYVKEPTGIVKSKYKAFRAVTKR
jgi:C1A family cysteine protease/fibronectin type 3 domain-containing protein